MKGCEELLGGYAGREQLQAKVTDRASWLRVS
jgi:hypothetical protein